ncbi:hypothetical protein GOP47_0028649 [Adiantum capillus-veneris]|nr:hypothetical protein GOP47_0028649 [Adiantum capillus-veneris]
MASSLRCASSVQLEVTSLEGKKDTVEENLSSVMGNVFAEPENIDASYFAMYHIKGFEFPATQVHGLQKFLFQVDVEVVAGLMVAAGGC